MPNEKEKIEALIRDHHLAFMVDILGKDSVPPEDYARLKAARLLGRGLAVDAATSAYVLGMLGSDKQPEEMKDISADDLTTKIPDLGLAEKESLAIIRDKIGNHVKALGDKFSQSIRQAMTSSESKNKLVAIRQEIASGALSRRSVTDVSRAAENAAKTLSKDWQRIAATEMHNAMDVGRAHEILATTTESDPLVYKRPRPDACAWCKVLYLDGKRPRIFRLSALAGNGDNMDRKAHRPKITGRDATEWLPVIGATHPWCQCALFHLRPGFSFDDEGTLRYTGLKKSILVEKPDHSLLHHECDHERF